MLDPNLNATEVTFDALGMVVATAVRGKTAAEGDPITSPTTSLVYDLLAFQERGGPTFVHTFAREEHFSVNPASRHQETFTYSDGFGRVVMTKVQAEPGNAPLRNPDGSLQRDTSGNLVVGPVTNRWVGSGRTVFNNKGNPVKQYEPFFSSTSAFETEDDLAQWGVTPIIHYDSIDRVVRTDLPDGTFTKTEYDAWLQKSFDQNDTTYDPSNPTDLTRHSEWYRDRGSPDPNGPEPSDPNQRAAWLSAQHASTPTTVHLDTLGRPFLSVAHNKTGIGAARVEEFYRTRTVLDIEGNTLAIYDAKQHSTAAANDSLNPSGIYTSITQRFDVLGRRLRIDSPDAGSRLSVQDVSGKPLRSWDSRQHTMRSTYDALQRPTHMFVATGLGSGAPEILVQRTVYGEFLDPADASNPPRRIPGTSPSAPSPAQALNLRGRAYLSFDSAGLSKVELADFKGNTLQASRMLALTYQTTPDWSAFSALNDPAAIETAATPLLEAETFTTSSTFDALNRVVTVTSPTSSTNPAPSISRPVYNEANLLEELHVSVRGSAESSVISNLDYNARGQRVLCEHTRPGGTASHSTSYDYDPRTFRLTRLITTRPSDSAILRDLRYFFDAVGNITEVQDFAATSPFFSGTTPVSGTGRYRYDALYRLTEAEGREHPGQQPTEAEPVRGAVPHPNDLQALERYAEAFEYDQVGNILTVGHTSPSTNWNRRYQYATTSNRLLATSVPGDLPGIYSSPYTYDAHGSMATMPHLSTMAWDYADRLQHTERSGGGNQRTYFTYDSSGQRVRKVYTHSGLTEERIYLGGFEIYQKRSGSLTGSVEIERETLHVMDDQRRIAMVETKLVDTASSDPAPLNSPRWRYQLTNHLDSAAIELDENSGVLSYEEYHPYGSTAFHTARGGAEVSAKRYRYTGKERDDETGLYYHGARYYAAWLGRWTVADPLGLVDGLNLYRYSRDNPINFSDPGGTETCDPEIMSCAPDAPLPEEEAAQASLPRESTGVSSALPAAEQGIASLPEEEVAQATLLSSSDGSSSGPAGTTEVNDSTAGSNMTGASALTAYESSVRSAYLREIKSASDEAVREIIAVEKAVAEGAISEAEGLAKAETISRAVSERRDALRAAAQEKLAPGGKMLSEALESKLSFDARLAEKGGASFEGYRSVAKSAGKSRALVSALAKVGRVAGPLGVAVGVGLSAKAYADAPEDQKADVAVEETVAFGASAVGATGGTALGVAGAAGIATLAGLSGPPGWLLLGLGLLGGAGGAYGLSEASRHGVRSLQGR